MSRTREAPTPTNISTKSEPEIVKKGTFASPAIAFASSVLPVPGGPAIKTPRGIRPPRRWNLPGSFKNSTSSDTSSFASSQPATSANVVLIWSSLIRRALDLPKDIGPPRPPPIPPCIWRMKNMKIARMINTGNAATSNCIQTDCCSGLRPSTTTLC